MLAAFVVFRLPLLSGFDKILASPHDGLLNCVYSAHWYHTVTGEEAWNELPAFYPEPHTLGYGDTLFLYGVAAIPLRVLGMDEFVSLQVVVFLAAVAGGLMMNFFLRRQMRLGRLAAGFGSVLFVLIAPIPSSLENGHMQLTVAWLVPAVIIGISGTLQALASHQERRAMGWAAATGVTLSVILFTAFYVGWFIGVVLAAMAAAWLLMAAVFWSCGERDGYGRFLALPGSLRSQCLAGTVFLGGFLLALIPFLLNYLPTRAEFGVRDWDSAILPSLPSWIDSIHVFAGNLVWGQHLGETLNADRSGTAWEWHYGLPPVSLAFFGAALVWAAMRARAEVRARLLFCFGIVFAVSWLVITNSFGLWRILYDYLPGAAQVRAPARVNLVLASGVVVSLAWLADGFWLRASRWVRLTVCLAGCFVLLEQVVGENRCILDRPDVCRYVSPPPIPGEAETFFIKDSQFMKDPWFAQVRAMLIAQRQGVPTICGYAAQIPKGWWLIDENYQRFARQWLYDKGVAGPVWVLNLDTYEWERLAASEYRAVEN